MSKVFNSGDKVIDGSEPFVIEIDDNERDKRCHYCFNECTNLKKCMQCLMVKYCSKDCQLKDWKDIHKFNECKLLKEVRGWSFSIDTNTRLIVRLVLKVTFDPKSKEKSYQLWDNRQRRVNDLMSHHDKINPGSDLLANIFSKHLIELIRKLFGIKLSIDQVWRCYGVIRINCFQVGNHCRPSCVRWFNGRKIQVRAMRTIDTSVEQPTVIYTSFADDRDHRRRHLAQYFFFDCMCKRCVEHEDKDLDLNRYQYLLDNQRNDDIDYWNEVIGFERRLVGPHFPNLTMALFRKWAAIRKQIELYGRQEMIAEWLKLTRVLEREWMITHGSDHPKYTEFRDRLSEVDGIVAADKSKTIWIVEMIRDIEKLMKN